MKKFMNLAVAVIMMTLCAVLFGSCGEHYTDDNKIKPTPEPEKIVDKIGCVPGKAGETTFSDGGVVEKMATRAVNFDTPVVDGRFTATTPFTSYFINTPDSVLKYTGDDVLEVIEVNKPRYVRNMSCMSSATLKRMLNDKDIFWGCTFNDGEDHALDFGLREKWICQSLVVSDPSTGGTKSFESCDNRVTDLKILGVDSIDGKRDSVDYHFMYAYVLFQAMYSNGAVGKFKVKIPVWKYIGSGSPEWPDGRQPVKYFYKKRWLENKTPNRIDSFMDLWVLYSDGTEADVDDQEIDLIDEVIEPELLVKEVDDLTWKAETAVPYDETADGARFEKKANIFVTPLIKMYSVKTDRGTQIYTLKREGRPVYVSPLGDELEFLEPTWSEKDLGWDDSELKDLDIFERKLLTNSAVFTLNEQNISANAKIELRKVKGESKIVDYEYTDFGIDLITPIAKYYTHATQWAARSDKPGEKTKVGTIGTYIGANVVEPQEQTVPVTTWDLHDLTYQVNPHVRHASRKDSTSTSTGVFTIESWKTALKTKTDATSNCPFDVYCDEVVTFVDKFNNKVNFLALKPTVTDKGGIKNGLVDVGTVNDQERKKMTSTINVKVNNENADYHGVVIFTKEVEKEELINDPNEDVKLDLKYIGNGIWNTSAKIKYVWKLKGTEYEPIAIDLDCFLKGEAKSQLIREKAEAPFNRSDFNNAWSAETKTYPQDFVTLYTKTKSLSEDYTTLTDKYTAQLQYAVIEKTVGGKHIYIKMLAPADMSFAHNEGSLKDGQRTVKKDGTEYNVWDHTGSVSATVISPKGNQTETAIDEKEILVKKEEPVIIPEHPEWGKPLGLLGQGTVVYQPGIGPSGQGVFYCNFNVRYEKGVVCYVTNTYIREGHTNPQDFAATGFWPYGTQLRGATLRSDNVGDLNSAIFRDGKFEPACCTYVPGKGVWTYMSPDGKEQGMTENLAETCGLKHFTGTNTAHLQPILYYTAKEENGALVIRNQYGGAVLSLK